MQSEGALRFACGGVGVGERLQMKALEREANVELLFVTARRGGYLADVALDVANENGKSVLRVTAKGPICLLQLPAGRYQMSATAGGVTRTSLLTGVGATGKPRRVVLSFPGEKWDGIWASKEEKKSADTR